MNPTIIARKCRTIGQAAFEKQLDDSRIIKLLGLNYFELEKQHGLWCRTHFPELLKKNTGRLWQIKIIE